MRVAILLGALAALAAAFPHPQEQEDPTGEPSLPTPTIPLPLSTSLNIPITGLSTSVPSFATPTRTRSRRPHSEPIPIFTKECLCNLATAAYPCWATDALQRCNFEENFSYGCYMQAARGCPTPTRVCGDLFKPTPRTGRHPCEMRQTPDLTTIAPTFIPTSGSALPTFNMSLPVLPTSNVTVPVSIVI